MTFIGRQRRYIIWITEVSKRENQVKKKKPKENKNYNSRKLS